MKINTNLLWILYAFIFIFPSIIQAAPSEVSPDGKGNNPIADCFMDMDHDALGAFELEVKNMEKEVNDLCQADKLDEAEQLALTYSKKISSSNEVQSIKQCGEISDEILKSIPLLAHADTKDEDAPHICD